MAKKKARKKDDIAFSYRIEGPRGMSKAKVFTAAIETARTGKKPPKGVAVTWKWRNSAKGKWREAPLAKAVRESRAGFINLIVRRLTRDALRDAPGFTAPSAFRTATAKEVRAIEREEEITQEKRESKHQPGGRELARVRETKAKRSAAAKKGWETRRAAAAKKAAAKPAAKKGKRK